MADIAGIEQRWKTVATPLVHLACTRLFPSYLGFLLKENGALVRRILASVVMLMLLPCVVVADDWQQVGVAVEQSITSVQLQGDRAYRQERPGFEINRNGATLDSIISWSDSARVAVN